MLNIIALTSQKGLVSVSSLEKLQSIDYKWFWVDFSNPSAQEVTYLEEYFHFHHLSIEDCLHPVHRPKVDFYEGYDFFVLYALNGEDLEPRNVNLFVGKDYLVTYHEDERLTEFTEVRDELFDGDSQVWEQGNAYAAYLIMDKLVDQYFPAIISIEDKLKTYDDIDKEAFNKNRIEAIFEIRADLLKLRRLVNNMKELMYKISNATHRKHYFSNKIYFLDIYDHLLKLSEIIDENRELTSDIRDSIISINTNRMNSVMTLLTIITTIFIPLTLITGIYGMNFKHMPELNHPYGYYFVVASMLVIGITMFLVFKKKGWFAIYK